MSKQLSVAGFEPTGQSRTLPRSMSYLDAQAVALHVNEVVAPDFVADRVPTSPGIAGLPEHELLLQTSPIVHALPSLQATVLFVCVHRALAQASFVQGLPSLHSESIAHTEITSTHQPSILPSGDDGDGESA